MNKYDYERLLPEYNAGFEKNYRVVHGGGFKISIITAAVFAVFFALSLVVLCPDGFPKDDLKLAIIIPVMPLVIIAFVGVAVGERKKWEQSKELIRTSAASYDCTIADCGGYSNVGRGSVTLLLFKFTYNKDGEVITDMVKLCFGGFYKGNIFAAKITLYETRGGENVISVTLPRKGEFRLIV